MNCWWNLSETVSFLQLLHTHTHTFPVPICAPDAILFHLLKDTHTFINTGCSLIYYPVFSLFDHSHQGLWLTVPQLSGWLTFINIFHVFIQIWGQTSYLILQPALKTRTLLFSSRSHMIYIWIVLVSVHWNENSLQKGYSFYSYIDFKCLE